MSRSNKFVSRDSVDAAESKSSGRKQARSEDEEGEALSAAESADVGIEIEVEVRDEPMGRCFGAGRFTSSEMIFGDVGVVVSGERGDDTGFELVDTLGELLVGGAHDVAHHGARAVEHSGGHDRAVLGKSVGQILAVPAAASL